MTDTVVIIGAGQAGAQVAFSLRQGGWQGRLLLLGAEAEPPYQRPPLSKAYLKGEADLDRLAFKPRVAYAEQDIDLVTDTTVTRVDRGRRMVHTADGGDFAYSRLVLATGARARRPALPGASLPGVHVVRTRADVDGLKPHLGPGRRLVLVGAGYIGLETAAAARSLGTEVTVVELAPRVLARVTGPEVAAFFVGLHASHGVQVLTGAALASVEGEGAVTGVRLADGRGLAADAVVFGIGIDAEDGLARQLGLGVARGASGGIRVDRSGRTNDPAIYACGDCTVRPLVHSGRFGRLESVHNALEQAKAVAASILGQPRPIEDTPWFWSDQYDVKLQIAGVFEPTDTRVVRGDPETGRFAVFYLRGGALAAVDAINSPAEFLASKPLIARAARIARSRLEDTSTPFKQIAQAAS
jgi:3-phenylpropionate/trans-cinnamate dioxygenase ferredoxin reductase subunit